MSQQEGDEQRIAPSNQKSSPQENRNAEGQPEDDGLGIATGSHQEAGSRGGPHLARGSRESRPDGDGGRVVVSYMQGDHNAINRNAISQPEGHELRVAFGNRNSTYTQTSTSPANRNVEGHSENGGPGIAGSSNGVTNHSHNIETRRSSSPENRNPKGPLEGGGLGLAGGGVHAIHRWENPDSAGGRAGKYPMEEDTRVMGFLCRRKSPPQSQGAGLQLYSLP